MTDRMLPLPAVIEGDKFVLGCPDLDLKTSDGVKFSISLEELKVAHLGNQETPMLTFFVRHVAQAGYREAALKGIDAYAESNMRPVGFNALLTRTLRNALETHLPEQA